MFNLLRYIYIYIYTLTPTLKKKIFGPLSLKCLALSLLIHGIESHPNS
jgi:hypothetical protein